jgi:hypothetical protein
MYSTTELDGIDTSLLSALCCQRVVICLYSVIAMSTCLVGLYDAIILDVDSKDVSTGVSSPPRAFIDKQFLIDTRLLLKESG